MIRSRGSFGGIARTLGRRARVLFVAASVAATLGSGCRRERAPAPAPAASENIKRGDVVVFEVTAAEFREGRVLEAASGRLRIEPAEGGDSLWTTSSDVYALDDAREPARGDFAICSSAPRVWSSCRVRSSDAVRFEVELPDERKLSLGAPAVLAARPVTVLNIKRHFERVAERRHFSESFGRAGEPKRPPSWVPGPHARVIARLEGKWYQAKIHEYDDEVPRVRLPLDERITELRLEDLAPDLPYDTTAVKRGDFVLIRPTGPAEPFRAAEVRSLGDKEFRVADRDGNVRTVSARDVVPLGAASP
jgi:hypothetical protein